MLPKRITLTVDVALNAPSSVTNVSAATGGGQSNTTNDSWSDVTQIEPPVSLNVFKLRQSGNRWPASYLWDYRRLLHARSRSFELCRLACRYGVQFLSPIRNGADQHDSHHQPRRRPRARLHSGHGTRPRRSMPFCCLARSISQPVFPRAGCPGKRRNSLPPPSFHSHVPGGMRRGSSSTSPPHSTHPARRHAPRKLHHHSHRRRSAASLQGSTTVTLTVNWNGL